MKTLLSFAVSGALLSGGLLVASATHQAAAPKRAKAAGVGHSIGTLQGQSISGATATVPVPGAKLTVVALTSATCPIAMKSGPALARLEDAYAAKGVRFVFLNPEPDADGSEIQAAVKRLGLNGAYTTKGASQWAQTLGAKTTTETFVIDTKGRVRYRGAMDDQYAIGASLPKPRNRYLANALDSLLNGKAPKVAATSAPGCLLSLSEPEVEAVPAYYGRIEKIVQAECLPCHREGGVAPFKFDSFAAVKARAPMIAYVVKEGIMPPWHAAKGTGPWRDDRTLSSADREALMTWAEKGTPKGDAKKAVPAPKFAAEWTIGKPDAVFQIPKPIAVAAEGTMEYQTVEVPTNYGEDRWVKGIEIMPTDRRVVHHVLVFLKKPGEGRTQNPTSFFGGYVPGDIALQYEPGLAKRLPKNATLEFQIHYTPNGKATMDRTKIGLIFAPIPKHEVHTTALANFFFAIPPNAANHPVKAELTTPADAEILSFLPHMHLRGKAARYELHAKDGTKSTLLDVPRYDFNWQLNYVYTNRRPIHAGDKIVYTAWYDNSAGNPSNPNPKKTVRWGDQTFDEMHLGYVEFILPWQKTASR